jgi:hypothetical protein
MHGYWKANKAQITRYWSIPAELIKAGVGQFTLRSVDLILFRIRRNCRKSGRIKSLCLLIRRLIEEIVVIIESYHLWTTWKISSNILLSGLTSYAEEISGDHHCGFRSNRSTAGHTFCMLQILTYLLTPWSSVLLEKLTGVQLVKKFPAFYGTRRFITASLATATCPYSEPVRFSPHPHIPLPEDPS